MILCINKYCQVSTAEIAFYSYIICCGFINRDLGSNVFRRPPPSVFSVLSAAGALSPGALSPPELPHPARQDTVSTDASNTLTILFFIVASFSFSFTFHSFDDSYRLNRKTPIRFVLPAVCTNGLIRIVHFVYLSPFLIILIYTYYNVCT